jgi:drug/metabolite transporter (DMT)-like permease
MADASLLAPISYVRLLFAAGFGMALFGEVPDWWLALGAAIITGSTLYITQREARLARERQS